MGEEARSSEVVRQDNVPSGESISASDLFQKYSARVYYLALRALRSPSDAEDVCGETFLRVLRSLENEQIRSPEAIGSFILGTARNVILELHRSPHRVKQPNEFPDIAWTPEDVPVDEDVSRAIEATICRLKPREREFLRLHYYEDLGKEEIARRIGIDAERVRLLKHRSLKSFREIYERLRKTRLQKTVDTKRP
jgi:RNA polymerase sigma factor (sigma-70 family)